MALNKACFGLGTGTGGPLSDPASGTRTAPGQHLVRSGPEGLLQQRIRIQTHSRPESGLEMAGPGVPLVDCHRASMRACVGCMPRCANAGFLREGEKKLAWGRKGMRGQCRRARASLYLRSTAGVGPCSRALLSGL
jgi:hypothetical protein